MHPKQWSDKETPVNGALCLTVPEVECVSPLYISVVLVFGGLSFLHYALPILNSSVEVIAWYFPSEGGILSTKIFSVAPRVMHDRALQEHCW